jgi:hypothetical protein
MKSPPPATFWIGAALCAALGLVSIMLIVLGGSERGVRWALLATGRLAFLFFWFAYAGGAIASLFGPVALALKQYARGLGLGFASVLFVHLGLVVWLWLLGAVPSVSTFIFFGIAAAFTYLLAFFSFSRVQMALGFKFLSLVRTVGLNYIALAFAVDFLNDPLHGGSKRVILYLPFAILAIAGPCLRAFAFGRRLSHRPKLIPIEQQAKPSQA